MSRYLRNVLLILFAPVVLLLGLAGAWIIYTVVKKLAEDDDDQSRI